MGRMFEHWTIEFHKKYEVGGTMNSVTLFGRLGQDPKLTASGKMVMFSVATGTKEKTQWHNVKAFNDLAVRCNEYLKKGARVVVQGSIEYSEHEGKKYTNILAFNVQFIDMEKKDHKPQVKHNDPAFTADEIPF